MQKLPTKKEFPWTKIRSYTDGNPWCIAFVYPRKSPAFLVKGGIVHVAKWIESTVTRAVVHYVMFHKGKTRTNTKILTGTPTVQAYLTWQRRDRQTHRRFPRDERWNLMAFIVPDKHKAFMSADKDTSTLVLDKHLRHPLRCWPKELDAFVMPGQTFSCPTCKEAIKGEGKGGVSGCKLSGFFNWGKNCPLTAKENPVEDQGVVVPQRVSRNPMVQETPPIVTVDVQPDFTPIPNAESTPDINDVMQELFPNDEEQNVEPGFTEALRESAENPPER